MAPKRCASSRNHIRPHQGTTIIFWLTNQDPRTYSRCHHYRSTIKTRIFVLAPRHTHSSWEKPQPPQHCAQESRTPSPPSKDVASSSRLEPATYNTTTTTSATIWERYVSGQTEYDERDGHNSLLAASPTCRTWWPPNVGPNGLHLALVAQHGEERHITTS
jgi:hypothetical protein